MLQKFWPLFVLLTVGVVVLALLTSGGGGEGAKRVEELEKEDLVVGEGKEAKEGDTVVVHYTGTLRSNGDVFDSSHKRGEPFIFRLGAGQVIKGWDLGVAGMREGGKRKLVIPAKLAYGPRAQGSIPANSDLVFEVELLKVK
jgi:FKBP-type peptidyl-prolyl cis-trans isomerase